MYKFLLMILTLVTFATASTAELPDSLLTDSQKAYLKAKNITTTNEALQQSASGWIGIGKELGIAMDESLKAISDRSNEFAESKLGIITVGLLVWKFIGKDLIHILEEIITDGLLILFSLFMLTFGMKYMRNNYPVVEQTIEKKDKEGNVIEKVTTEALSGDAEFCAWVARVLIAIVSSIIIIAVLCN